MEKGKMIDFPIGRKHMSDRKAYIATEQKQYFAYICKPEQGRGVVVSGVVGELYKSTLQQVVERFALPGGFSLEAYLKKNFEGKPLVFDWLKVQSIPAKKRFHALYIPQSERFTFTCPLGKSYEVNKIDCGGSFVVCSDLRGQPNLADMQVVCFDIFIRTYTLRGKLAAFKDDKKAAPATPKPQKSLLKSIVLKDNSIEKTIFTKDEKSKYNKIIKSDKSEYKRTYADAYHEFYAIALGISDTLREHGFSHTSYCPQQVKEKPERYVFQYVHLSTRIKITMMIDMETWKYAILFGVGVGRYYIRGKIRKGNVNSAVRMLSEAIIKNRQ